MITETFHTDCAIGLAYKLNNIPVVGLSSCVLMPYYYARFGLPDSPSYIPSLYVGFGEKMSLYERTANYFITKMQQFLFKIYQTRPDNEMLKKRFGPDFPDIQLLVRNVSLALVNQHYAMGGARSAPPNVLDVGGVHVIGVTNKELPEDLQLLLDQSTEGVILMSFGSMTVLSSLPEEKINMLMRVFGRLGQTVIMKWENISVVVPNRPENVHFLDWLPQREILAHSNVKLFFSHGGMMGSQEALANRVPVLGTPLFGDQFVNLAAIANRKAGLLLNYKDWTDDTLLGAIRTCLTDECV